MATDEANPSPEGQPVGFMFTRALVMLAGIACLLTLAAILIGGLSRHQPHPSEGDEDIVAVTDSNGRGWLVRDLSYGLLLSGLPVAAMIVVWHRPRLGFLLSGSGWVFCWALGLMWCLLRPEERCQIGLAGVLAFVLPLLWLSYAWWKIGPTPGRSCQRGNPSPGAARGPAGARARGLQTCG
jgi:hypothetical protein